MTLTTSSPPNDGMGSRILVAVDFGTTFSGVAWTQTARPEIQTTIIQWPDAGGSLEGATSDKVPTELVYEGSNCKWGYQIEDSIGRHQWFKLEMDPHQSDDSSYLTIRYADPKALPPSYDKSPQKLAVDYLTCLREHISKILKLKLGEGVVGTTPLEFIITVPAIWDDAAKYHTRSCAKMAGMGEPRIVSEPEAAVIYALDAMDPYKLQVGDTFVLCDAGGGTVDLISYTIDRLYPSVKIRETVKGSGDRCGSTFLNRIFRKYLENNFGDHEGWDDDTLEEALQRFENTTKRKFDGSPDDILIPVPGLCNDRSKGVMRGKLTISGETMCTLFEPVMAAITTLVKAQVKMTGKAKAVLLVGGFGQSPYLRGCIQKVVGSKVEVIQPPQGWTAVVRGALIKGLSDISPQKSRINIVSRIARKAYGTTNSTEYNLIIHDEKRRFWDAYDGFYRINTMHWFVQKGDTVKEDSPQVTSWWMDKPVSEGPFRTVNNQVYAFSHPWRNMPPMYQGSDVKPIAILRADLSKISISQIPIKKGKDGLDYYILKYEIHVVFFSAHTEYSLWFNDVCYGSVEAEYV